MSRSLLGVFHFRLGDVDLQLAVRQRISIEHADGFIGFGLFAHRNEGEALRTRRCRGL